MERQPPSLFQMASRWKRSDSIVAMTAVIAHRGASAAERENTLAAFQRAGELGADAVELDVRRTGDGQLVVHHDPLLADGREICAVAAADLPAHVPTLDAALDACAGMFVNIEIKNDPDEPDFDPSDWVAHRLGVALTRRGQTRRWLISSFRFETVGACRVIVPGVRTAWLVESFDPDVIALCARAGHDAVHPEVSTVEEGGLRRAHAAGLAVNVWTCDDPDRIGELVAWGVDGICTNVPDVALAVRRRCAGAAGSVG
jgi:glycerophosphoryl diester phosphodiesterase